MASSLSKYFNGMFASRKFWFGLLLVGFSLHVLAAVMMPVGLDGHLHATMVTDGMDDGDADLEWGPIRTAETDQSTPSDVPTDGRWWSWHLWIEAWFTIFGTSITTLHFMSVTTSFLSLLTVYLTTKSLWNEEDALRLTALTAVYSPMFRAAGRVYQEGAILLLVTLAFAALILGEKQRKSEKLPLWWIGSIGLCAITLAMKGMPEYYAIGLFIVLLIWPQIDKKEFKLDLKKIGLILISFSILTLIFRLYQINFSINDYFIDIVQSWVIAWITGGFIFIYAGMGLFIRKYDYNNKITLLQLSSIICSGVIIGWIAAMWMVEAISLDISFFELWPESFRHNPRYASLLIIPLWWFWMERDEMGISIQPEKSREFLLIGAILIMLVLNSYHLATTGTRGMEVIGEELSNQIEKDDHILFVAPAPLAMHRLYSMQLTLDPNSDSDILAHWRVDSGDWITEIDGCNESLQGVEWIIFDFRVDTEINENWDDFEIQGDIDERWRVYHWAGAESRC